MASIMGNRFFTFNTVIRVNQIEASRDLALGEDESKLHTPECVEALRKAFERGWPGGRMTWAFSWRALIDERPNYRQIRALVAGYHHDYGDDVTINPGGYFSNVHNTREQINCDLHEGLQRVSEFVGNGFRPQSVIAGFLAAENHRYLAEQEGIHVCQGNIWSQYGVDNQDGEGSVCYPYYPSREHFCKPAQSAEDFIDCVSVDGWTMDFLAARRPGFQEGFNSRLGVGPIETVNKYGPEIGLRQMLATTATHFDQGFDLNGFAWITDCWEVALVDSFGHLECLTQWLTDIRRRWPDALCVTTGEFGRLRREEFSDNARMDYRFVQRGTGVGGSDANLEIRWYMNRDFRLALLHDWVAKGPKSVIDFTRYDLPAREPRELGVRDWSLYGAINQKQSRPQDTPVPLCSLPMADWERIRIRYPELAAG